MDLSVASDASHDGAPERSRDDRLAAHLDAVVRGDVRAFRRLHAELHGPVLAFAARMLGRHDRAEEVAQDTMLAVWRGASRFEGRSRVTTWVFGIAYRLALKSRRRFGFERLHVALEAVLARPDPALAVAEAMVDAETVAAALAVLPPEHRAIMHMTFHYGFTYAEIGEVTGLPVGTIKTRMAAARQRMQAHLGEGGR